MIIVFAFVSYQKTVLIYERGYSSILGQRASNLIYVREEITIPENGNHVYMICLSSLLCLLSRFFCFYLCTLYYFILKVDLILSFILFIFRASFFRGFAFKLLWPRHQLFWWFGDLNLTYPITHSVAVMAKLTKSTRTSIFFIYITSLYISALSIFSRSDGYLFSTSKMDMKRSLK